MQQLFRLFAESGNGDISVIAALFSVVVVFALGWFISYMMDFILQRRSKEISTYMILGVEKNANEFKKKMAGAGMIHTSDRTGGNAESGAGSASAAAGVFPIRQGIQKIRL